jgi:hypothetical protein
MTALRHTTALLGSRRQCVALDQRDPFEMIGQYARGQKSGHAST